ncbi:hypothetical protein EON81_02320 [bacterium]|nr:MAG: hypothetical protein EON81_02320 [bacterium]
MSAGSALLPFGFTALESEIYGFLARESPATGYRIAQGIEKPAANVYKALQTLESKGAVLVEDEGDARQMRAVPAEELLTRLSREFQAHQKAAREAFARVARPTEDERVYTFRSVDAALAQARDRLAEATQVVVAALGEEALAALQEDLAAVRERGVDVALLTVDGGEEDIFEGADSDELRLAVDARAALVGRLGIDPWIVASRGTTFAEGVHRGLAAEIALAHIHEELEDGAGSKRISRALEKLRLPPQSR